MIWITIAMTSIAIMLFTAYILGIQKKYGILPSISDSAYFIDKKNLWLFRVTLFTAGLAVLFNGILFQSIPLMISGSLLFGVGIFARFRRSKRIMCAHVVCAFGGYVAALLAFKWYVLAIIFIAAAVTLLSSLKYAKSVITWNNEVVFAYGIFLGIIFLFISII